MQKEKITKSIKNKIISFLYYPVLILYLEIIYKLFALEQNISFDLIYTVIIAISLGSLLYLLSTLFQHKYNKIFTYTIVIFNCLIVIIQYIYYKLFFTPMAIFSVKGAGQVLEFANMVWDCVVNNFLVLILFIIPIVCAFIFTGKKVIFEKLNIKQRLIVLAVYLISYIVIFILLAFGGMDIASDFDLYYGDNVPNLVATRFGIIKEMEKDFSSILPKKISIGLTIGKYLTSISSKDNEKVTDASNNTNINNTSDTNSTNSTNSSSDTTKISDTNTNIIDIIDEEKPAIDTSPNVMKINFDELINNGIDASLIDMDKYFSSVEPTCKNEHTGIFKDYNLILITAEGFSYLAVDENITPTLYKMANECFVFNNFYNPVWGVSTSDGEYVACQGLLPKSGVWSFLKSGENYLPFVMGNQFKGLGYSARAYHNHYYGFYGRDVSHPNMGYDYKALGHGLDVKETWPESDLEMMELTIPEYIEDEKFHTYYMTVSGHMYYTFYGNYIAGKNRELVEDIDASEGVKAYYACNIELDKAMELLINKLEEKGIADKTVIAISADHYPYGLEKAQIDELAGHEVEENFELYKSTFILWTKGRATEIIDKPCSSLDIIPTLSNLFGLEYDSRLLMGKDIFSDSEPLVIFANRSFITDKAKYNSITKEVTNLQDGELEEDYIANIKKIVANKFLYSAEVLNKDYYAHIFNFSK